MLPALLPRRALEYGVRAGAAGARRAIDLTAFEEERRRIQSDGEPQQRTAAETGIRTLLEVSEKPRIDSSSFCELFGAEAELCPSMGHATGQVADLDRSRRRRGLCTLDAGAWGRGARSPLSWSRWCHVTSVNLRCASPIGTKVLAPVT